VVWRGDGASGGGQSQVGGSRAGLGEEAPAGRPGSRSAAGRTGPREWPPWPHSLPY
jgi:hypothetical protein